MKKETPGIRGAFFALAGALPLVALTLAASVGLAGTASAKDSPRGRVAEDDPRASVAWLATYNELVDELHDIAARSRGRIDVGPLIKRVDKDGRKRVGNGGRKRVDNGGLLDISDNEIDSVIGTVPKLDRIPQNVAENFGRSTQGRELMAARLGNPHGRRVLMITQQHGNEVFATEAALMLLRDLARRHGHFSRTVHRQLDLLVIVRANPDGGEPDLDRCFSAHEFTVFGPPFGGRQVPLEVDCALYRFNVDPSAGLSLGTLSEDGDLNGAWGHGYDLNRFHFYDLSKPILPMETQAIVAAYRHFKPEVLLDHHHKNLQVRCAPENLEPGPPSTAAALLGFTNNDCVNRRQARPINASVLFEGADELRVGAERLGAAVLRGLNRGFGKAGRFAQQSSTLPPTARAAATGAALAGAVGGAIEAFGTRDVVLVPDIAGFGRPCPGQDENQDEDIILCPNTFSSWPGLPEGGRSARAATWLQYVAMRTELLAIARGVTDATENNGGYDSNPAWAPPNLDLIVLSDQWIGQLITVLPLFNSMLPPDRQIPPEAILDDPRTVLIEVQ